MKSNTYSNFNCFINLQGNHSLCLQTIIVGIDLEMLAMLLQYVDVKSALY